MDCPGGRCIEVVISGGLTVTVVKNTLQCICLYMDLGDMLHVAD